jgi:alkylhydroperoxidase/carboxymuconolactone decarboxylase family protein YurZ
MRKSIRASIIMAALCLTSSTLPSRADDTSADATYKEIQGMLVKVPEFVKKFPKAGVAGAWAEERDLELSDKTALPPKTKALISLAVAAQVPVNTAFMPIRSQPRDLALPMKKLPKRLAWRP